MPETSKLGQFSDALDLRSRLFSDALSGTARCEAEMESRGPSIVKDYYCISLGLENNEPHLSNYYTSVFRDVLEKSSLTKQLETIEFYGLVHAGSFRNGPVFLGFLNSKLSPDQNGDLELAYDEVASHLDGSLIHQSRVLGSGGGCKFPKSLKLLQESMLKQFKAHDLLLEKTTDVDFQKLVDGCLGHLDVSTVTGLIEAIKQLKKRFWFCLGVDLFVGLQLMLDPKQDLTLEDLHSSEEVCQSFGCSELFYKIVRLRSLRGCEPSAKILKLGTRNEALNSATKVEDNLNHDFRLGRSEVLELTLGKQSRIYQSMEQGNTARALSEIVELYQIDPQALKFLNWTYIAEVYGSEHFHDEVLMASLNLLASRYATFSNSALGFFKLGSASSRGSARFVNAVDDALRSNFVNFDAKVNHLIRQISRLPDRMARLMVSELLNRETLKVIPFFASSQLRFEEYGVTKSGTQKSRTKVDRFVSNVRYRLAEGFHELGLIDDRKLKLVSDEEVDFIKMLYFYEFDSAGRIRSGWKQFATYLRRNFGHSSEDTKQGLVFSETHDAPDVAISSLTESISRRITQHILYRAPYSLDWCLSNYVRHGQFVSAYDAALTETIVSAAKDILGRDVGFAIDIDDPDVASEVVFPAWAEEFQKLRSELINYLEEFRDYWLRVDAGREIEQNIMGKLRGPVFYYLRTSEIEVDRLSRFVDATVTACRSEFDQFLILVRTKLHEELTPRINEEIMKFREIVELGEDLAIDTQIFDSLEVKLNVVTNAVSDWLQISDGSIKIEDFDLKDLAKYIMSTLFASSISPDQLFIQTRFRGYPQSDYTRLMSGEFFDFFLELLHNSIMNAFVHSGLGKDTFAELTFEFSENSFVLHSKSNISSDKASYFFNNHRKLQAAASSQEVLEQAIEGGSGLARIKKSAFEAFGALPEIDIKRNHPSVRTFEIVFSFDAVGEVVARRKD